MFNGVFFYNFDITSCIGRQPKQPNFKYLTFGAFRVVEHPTNWSIDYVLKNKDACNTVLQDSNILKEIPSLNTTSLDYFQDGQLVRFRGMLQDMYNPEYYLEMYQVIDKNTGEKSIRCGTYRDAAKCLPHEKISFDSVNHKNSERQTCIVITVPGLNEWVKEKSTKPNEIKRTTTDKVKRPHDENDAEPMDCCEPIQKKEKINDNSQMSPSLSKDEVKKPQIISKDYVLNFPLPDENGKACIVKIYDEDVYKLNEVLDIIGFLSLDPQLANIHDDECMDEAEKQVHHPPASLVPRLHAVKIFSDVESRIPNDPPILSKAECIRGDLHLILSQLLFGDTLAADYIICHLISSIYVRQEPLSLGSLPINITHFPFDRYKTFPKELYRFLSQLVEKSHFLPLSLECLNDSSFIPKKDYDCNRLTSGILQLSKNTHLIIDETNLTSGQVTDMGRKNYNAISNVITNQRIAYDFKFYEVNYDCDIPVMILSEVKSFIPCPTQMILKPQEEIVNTYAQVLEAAQQYFKDENRLNNIRDYLRFSRKTNFELNDEMAKQIQDDFVDLRKNDKEITADNLHSFMVLSRLMSLSHGLTTLNADFWQKTMKMEAERKNRLPPKRTNV